MSETEATVAQILRKKFPPEEVGKLPRVTCPNCSDKRKQCTEHVKIRCETCKSYISERHIHIDYVGHADVTSRLLEADEEWNWEPKARDIDPAVLAAAVATGDAEVVRQVLENAPPKFDLDERGAPVGLWIRLTVGGVTRPGYGSCPSGQSDPVKVLIGDALRNAAMRFGVALDLWAKGERADPSAENATASAGQVARGRQRERFEDARPANGNGRQGGQVRRPEQPPPAAQATGEPDPDAQPYADEAHEARTLAALQDIQKRAREAGKLTAAVVNPATQGKGRLAEFIDFHRKRLQEIDHALALLNDVAKRKNTDLAEVEIELRKITGKGIEDATPAEMRKAAEQMLAGVPA